MTSKLCYIVFINHSLHWRYIKITLRKYIINGNITLSFKQYPNDSVSHHFLQLLLFSPHHMTHIYCFSICNNNDSSVKYKPSIRCSMSLPDITWLIDRVCTSSERFERHTTISICYKNLLFPWQASTASQ